MPSLDGTDVLGLDGDGGVVYQINGVDSASAAAWATDVQAFITSSAIDPTLTVTVDADDDLVFNVEG